MKQQSSFYARHALTILCAAAFVFPLAGLGALRALQSNSNDVREWLPSEYTETREYEQFKQRFGNEEFVVVTWDGCNINDPRLSMLVAKLQSRAQHLDAEASEDAAGQDSSPAAPQVTKTSSKTLPPPSVPLFNRIITGRSILKELTQRPVSLEIEEVLQRFHGVLFGQATAATAQNHAELPSPDDYSLDPDQIASHRLTCAVVTLTDAAKAHLPATLAEISRVAIDECSIPAADLKLGGPPVVNVAIDVTSAKSLSQLAVLSGVVGLFLAWLFFKSVRLTAMVFITAGYSAAASLAMVWLGGDDMNAILITMAPLVYVAAMSGSIHLANYYKDSIRDGGPAGAADRAIGHAWLPLVLATSTTAVGLLSLLYSELEPIQLFGKYSAIGVVVSSVLLFFALPAALELFAPKKPDVRPKSPLPEHDEGEDILSPRWQRFCRTVIGHQGKLTLACLALLAFCGWGMTRIETSIKIMRFFSPNSDIIHTYQWLEANLGALVPMEVIVRVDPRVRETAADKDSRTLDLLQRMELVQQAQTGVKSLVDVGSSLSAVNFAKQITPRPASNPWPAEPEYTVARSTLDSGMQKRYDRLISTGYLRNVDGEELWRISLRVASLKHDLEYGTFKNEIMTSVEAVLDKQRRALRIAELKALAAEADAAASDGLDDAIAALASGDRDKIAAAAARSSAAGRGEVREVLARDLERQHEGIEATYTGMVPVVYKAQRSLLDGLIFGFTTDLALIVVVIIILMRHWSSGLMLCLTSVFPVTVVFGMMGLSNIVIDIGTVMTPSVALGVTVDDVVHFLLKFKKGILRGESRAEAVMTAYRGCARAMYQSWGVIGLGLAMFAFSSFTPTMRFGALMVSLLTVGLVGNLVFLPALMAGPLGGFIERSIKRQQARKDRKDAASSEPPHDDAQFGPPDEACIRPQRRGAMSHARLLFAWLWSAVASIY